MRNPVRKMPLGKHSFNAAPRVFRNTTLVFGKAFQFLPEGYRIPQRGTGNPTQPAVPFTEHIRLPAGFEAFLVAGENSPARILLLDREMARTDSEMRARCQPRQIDRIR